MACADFRCLANTIEVLEKADVEVLHFDFCDGHFAPTFLFSPIILKSLRPITSLRFDAHMYCQYPSRYIDELESSGVDIIIVQVEAKEDYRKAIQKICNKGLKAGVGILPESSVPSNITDVLPKVSLIVPNTVAPAYYGQPFNRKGLANMKMISSLIRKYKYDIEIGADGGVGAKTLKDLLESGANLLICGTTSIFGPDKNLNEEIEKIRETAERYLSRQGHRSVSDEGFRIIRPN